ncbi:membrane protein insertase YidC [Canibacter sp. lx-72]|uniref:membrane protein insertase YidC n=1 Tax=Canibacter zhuwentaonis TaxID=2837491 RepID=UPI001BDD0490|nr:membrane protein insertase YidC [Canibacter zhuwentaonis]MBT1018117.1 membrane protein insertase YidC [Canibacter zhuwentaonis]MBT1035348.1 membrane protein insertase YidC [Canibacter zhuwentaonis]
MENFFELILWPLKWAIEALLALWHNLFTGLGLETNSGAVWVLSILGVVLVVRAVLIPLTIKQIKSQRKMLEVAPKIRKIQGKYKNKKDQYSREAMNREVMAMYKETGTNPFTSCLPILVQMPVFFSMYFVLKGASEGQNGIGFLTHELAQSFSEAVFLGAPIRMTFSQGIETGNVLVAIFLGVIMALMVVSQFFSQKQILSKNISDETKQSPMYRQQQMLMYILPFMFLISGFVFPLALNIYWLLSNMWTIGQQAIVINAMPNPGSEAWRKREARLRAKGKLPANTAEIAAGDTEQQVKSGQRQQPVSGKRAKKKRDKK